MICLKLCSALKVLLIRTITLAVRIFPENMHQILRNSHDRDAKFARTRSCPASAKRNKTEAALDTQQASIQSGYTFYQVNISEHSRTTHVEVIPFKAQSPVENTKNVQHGEYGLRVRHGDRDARRADELSMEVSAGRNHRSY